MLLAAAMVLLWAGMVHAENCGSLFTHYGPFDYRTDRDKLPVVENYHFRPEVEALVRSRKMDLPGQLNYTLHAFPNHHRALMALIRYSRQEKSAQPKKVAYSVDCYFDRALRFRPNDTTVRMIFAQYLASTGRQSAAMEQLNQAVEFAGDNGWTHYNIGLVYLELGRYEQAQVQALRAQSLGFDGEELKSQLQSKGQWSSAATPASAPTPN